MTTAALKGFITRKDACEKFDISDRSIGRYLKKAMVRSDQAFLSNFKLSTLDGEVFDGPKATLQLIDELQNQGRVPTWYVSSEWLARKFKVRSDQSSAAAESQETTAEVTESGGVTETKDSPDEIVSLLKERVSSLEDDKRKLEEEKKEMREDARETRKLMNQMQQLMGHLQDRLLPEQTKTRTESTASNAVVNVADAPSEKPTATVRSNSRAKRRSTQPKRKETTVGSPIKRKTPKTTIWHRDIRDLIPFRKK